MKIVLAEDEKNLRDNLVDILENFEYQVFPAKDGSEAFALCIKHEPDLIISDILMPHLSGFELLKKVRETKPLANVPFILLTAKTDTADIRYGMFLGADDYIFKPFSAHDLLHSIETRINRKIALRQEIDDKINELKRNISNLNVHELRTPINTLLTGSEFIKNNLNELSKEEIGEIVSLFHLNALRLEKNITKLSLFQRLSDGLLNPIHFQASLAKDKDLVSLIKQLLEEFNILSSRKLIVYPPEIPLVDIIHGAGLKIILTELIENAIKFGSQSKPISLHAEYISGNVRIIISNIVSESFPAFRSHDLQRFSMQEKTPGQGMLIGLKTVQMIAKLLNYEIKVMDDVENNVSSIFVDIPV
jgi:DNA-binding response OmpR family regulator